jgi:diacylglycerol kinase family enzyme
MEGAAAAPPLVVVNPTASRLVHGGRRDRIVEAVVAAVEARTGRSASVVDTTPEAARDALAAARTAPLVTAVGGDGTVREAAAAMAGSGVPIAIVPAGTGNVFAAALGIPRRTEAAIELVRSGQPSLVDLGQAAWGPAVRGEPGPEEGSKPFVVACGLGFDARVMSAATTDLKHRHGFRAYVFATLREAIRLRPVTFRIEADGDVHEIRGLVVLIANCGQIIPGFIGPRRSIDATDGLLDVMVVHAAGIPGGLAGAADLLLAEDDMPRRRRHSLRLRAKHVRVSADPPEPVEVDGDPHEADWLEATVLPGAISVLRP